MAISDYNATPAENKTVPGTPAIQLGYGGYGPQAHNIQTQAIQKIMADLKDFSNSGGGVFARTVATRDALKGLNTSSTTTAILKEPGREGLFAFFAGDYSAEVTADTLEGVYIAADDTLSSAGAWRRIFVGSVFPEWFGAAGDGATDDVAAVQAAIAYARSIAAGISTSGEKAVVDLGGKMYGLGSTLFCDTAANVSVENGALKAVGTWTETDNIMRAVNPTGDSILNFSMHRVFLDCDHKCTGLRIFNVARGRFSFVRVSHQKNYGIKAEVKNTDTVFDNCAANQFDFGETGWDAIANRTADGFWIDCPDVMLVNCVAHYNKRNLLGTGGTCQIINFHPYNGGTVDGSNNINIELDGARGYTILGLYNDAGIIRIRGEADNEFAHRIDGFTTKGATSNNVNAVELVATRANENAAGLYINMTSRGLLAAASLLLSTEGSGTWSDIKGSVLFRDQAGTGSCDGTFVVPDGSLQNPGLSFSENAGDGFYSPSPNRVGAVAANAAAAFFTTAGVLPGTNNTSTLGTVSEYWQALFSNRLHIRDNVSAPGAVQAGFCTLYVDAADGDLKILFSDGTTKTIMTDT